MLFPSNCPSSNSGGDGKVFPKTSSSLQVKKCRQEMIKINVYVKKWKISCRSARTDKTSTTARRSYSQGPKVRPRLPKKPLVYPLSLSLSCPPQQNPFVFLTWWGNRTDCSSTVSGYEYIYRKTVVFRFRTMGKWKSRSPLLRLDDGYKICCHFYNIKNTFYDVKLDLNTRIYIWHRWKYTWNTNVKHNKT